MARYKKGESGNPSGRPSGSRNKTPEQIRELIGIFLKDHWKEVPEIFKKLKPVEQARFIDALLKYYVPVAVHPEKLSEEQLLQVIEYLKENETHT